MLNYRYEDVVSYIINQVERGNLKPGKKAPSIREVSMKIGVSTSTAIRGYKELEIMNVIYSVSKSGHYITKSELIKETKDKEVNFMSSIPDNSVIPYTELKLCINKAIDTYKDEMFSYTISPQGTKSLRQVLSKQLQNSQIFTRADNIFITSGVQQILDILSRMPFPNGKKNVLVEQPTYIGIINILKLNNINILGIKRTRDGIDFNNLETIFKYGNVKFFYTMPRFQNPSGYSYNKYEKKKIVDLAARYNVYIVEDDYLGELEIDTKADPLYCFDQFEKVIYIKTYSKTIMPGLKVAAAVVPNYLSEMFLRYKQYCDKGTSIISQGALEIFISSGMFHKYEKKLKIIYENKMNIFREAYKKYGLTDMPIYVPKTGFFIYMELPEKVNVKRLISLLKDENILTMSCEEMFLENFKGGNALRISLSSALNSEIEYGIRTISRAISKY